MRQSDLNGTWEYILFAIMVLFRAMGIALTLFVMGGFLLAVWIDLNYIAKVLVGSK